MKIDDDGRHLSVGVASIGTVLTLTTVLHMLFRASGGAPGAGGSIAAAVTFAGHAGIIVVLQHQVYVCVRWSRAMLVGRLEPLLARKWIDKALLWVWISLVVVLSFSVQALSKRVNNID